EGPLENVRIALVPEDARRPHRRRGERRQDAELGLGVVRLEESRGRLAAQYVARRRLALTGAIRDVDPEGLLRKAFAHACERRHPQVAARREAAREVLGQTIDHRPRRIAWSA